jgi:hypothetical protein
MNGRLIRAVVGIAATVLVLVPGAALGSKTFFSATDGNTLLSFALKTGSEKQKLVDFQWDKLKCGSDRLTAGLGDPVKVQKDGSFESEQTVVDAPDGMEIEAKLKGQVAKDATKVTGKLKLTGTCGSKVTFKATPSAG